jgi:predicted CxxxxCH...CXXCH cytochrome family protein
MKILQLAIVLLFTVTLWGCGKGNPNAPVTIDPVTQKHAAGWAANGTGGAHPDAYFAASASCKECHGEPTDTSGGISGVSCSNTGRSGVACHASFPHVEGFAAFAVHGSVARDVASGITGMAHCQKCHGSDYKGGVGPSCIACHKGTNPTSNAPHAANWISGNANGLRHSATNVSNAPACAQCHLGGANTPTSLKGHTPPAGLAPDCFNNTLCHAQAGHALPYVTGHQAAAKANLSSCSPSCHATPPATAGDNPRFNQIKGTGVLRAAGCEGCHTKPGIAHPFMWLPGRGGSTTSSHATAGSVNGSCGLCHGGTALTGGNVAYPGGGIIPPSCFSTPPSLINGTACHFTKPVDTQGADVGCVSCHGAPPNSASPTAAPNRAFRHTAHFATATYNLAGLTCSACHSGLGSGTTSHATRAVFAAVTAAVSVDPKFNENGLTATYTPSTQRCTNVSCHGGKNLAPLWKNSAIFTQGLCLNCHTLQPALGGAVPSAYAGPYIGPFSGNQVPDLNGNNLHNTHLFLFQPLNPALICLKCHATPGIGHYANIMLGNRPLTPGFAAGTIGGTGIVRYTFNNTTPPTSTCVTIPPASQGGECHVNAPSPRSWF